MGVREALNENRAVRIGVISALILLGAFWIFRTSFSGSSGKPKAFFTDDDGATWFADDADKLPPFDHNGKQAVMCFVYKTGTNGKPWVSHLQRFTAEGLKQRKEPQANKNPSPMGFESMQRVPIEVKEPKTGDKGWVLLSDPRAAAIQTLKSPDGSTGEIIAVDPSE